MSIPSTDRLSYDVPAADATVQEIGQLVARIEQLIGDREKQAQEFLGDFRMTHGDEEYRRVETRWNNASKETREIVNIVKQTIDRNSQTATGAVAKARGAIANIG